MVSSPLSSKIHRPIRFCESGAGLICMEVAVVVLAARAKVGWVSRCACTISTTFTAHSHENLFKSSNDFAYNMYGRHRQWVALHTSWSTRLRYSCFSCYYDSVYYSSSGTAVAQWLRCCATNRKVAGSIPDGVFGIFHWHNPPDRTMALGSTQPLTEMSTRRISWG